MPGQGGLSRTPLFSAQHADRYDRQRLISDYQKTFDVNLIVLIDQIFAPSTTLLQELLSGLDHMRPLHLVLASPGGDPEVAVRLLRSLQAATPELTIIVPDMAKSAATLMCLGADKILMAPSSDLGPVDPQFYIGQNLVPAKEIVRAVQRAEDRVAAVPDSFPLYSSLLAEIDMTIYEAAVTATDRSYGQIEEALRCRGLEPGDAKRLAEDLRGPLVNESTSHGSTIGPDAALGFGLPVEVADTQGEQWSYIWALWTRYYHLGAWPAGAWRVYEGHTASQILPPLTAES